MGTLVAAIVAVIVTNGLFAFWQSRAERALEALERLLPERAKTIREGDLFAMLEAPSAPLWWTIRAVLAVAGCVFFCIQTALLDAIVWPAFFPFP